MCLWWRLVVFWVASGVERTARVRARRRISLVGVTFGSRVGWRGVRGIFIFIIVVGICYLILHQTKFGRNIYLVGSNESSAKLLGVNINKTVFGTYIISGLSAALAAIILTSRTGSASPSVGVGFEFEAIVAAVLGGTYLLGGRGTIGAVIIGSLIIGILSNGMILMGMTFEIQSMVLGFLFIFIVGIQGYSYSRSKK